MTKQWEVIEGDLVVKKGRYEAHVYFVERIGYILGDSGDISDILLVDGVKDVIFEGDYIDEFFADYRILAKKENLEIENQLYTVTIGCNEEGRIMALSKSNNGVNTCLCDEIYEENLLTELEIKNSDYDYLFNIAEKAD